MKNKNETLLIVYVLIGGIILSIAIILLILLKVDGGDTLSFFGAILGGIIGGLFTYGGVQLSISEQRRKEYYSTLPRKIINLDNLKNINSEFGDLGQKLYDIQTDIEFLLAESDYSSDFEAFFENDFDGISTIKELFEEYNIEILRLSKEWFELAVEVDVETYTFLRSKIDNIRFRGVKWIMFNFSFNPNGNFNIEKEFKNAIKNRNENLKEITEFLKDKKLFYEKQLGLEDLKE